MTMEDNKEFKSLPMIPLRGLVAFPGNVFHFEAGRRKTIIALNQAMEKASPIFLLSQCKLSHLNVADVAVHGELTPRAISLCLG